MMYYHLVAYFLVVIWIQDGVAQYEPTITITANTTTVRPGEAYTITCQSIYTNLWIRKNKNYYVKLDNRECRFAQNVKKYECSSIKPANSGFQYGLVLTVLPDYYQLPSVNWDCYYDKNVISETLNITFGRLDPSTRPIPRKTSSTGGRTPSSTQSPRQSSSSSKDHRKPRRPPSTNTPVGQPPVTTPSGTTTIILIAICFAVGVLILSITIFAVMFLHNKRKQKRTKRGPIRPVANRPSPAAAAAAIGTYDIVDDTSPPRNDFGDDFGNTYDTADSFAPPTSKITDPNYDTTEGDAPQASTNPNFDPSKVYGVVNKKDPVADTKDSYGEAEAGVNNPNFDPDKVYGVVNKSAKCQNPVSESTTENIYVNQ